MEPSPAADVVRRIASLAGARPVGWRSAPGGATLAQRWVVEFEGGTRAFAKVAANARTAAWLRAEHGIYSSLTADWLAKVLGWSDDGRQPILLLEDLGAGVWPPPWTAEQVGQVLATLAEVRRAAISVPLLRLVTQRQSLMRWQQIARDPGPFLSLGLCTAGWLARALPRLMAAEAAAELDGDDLVHGDLKGGNICFHEGRCVLIDWNWACRGNGLVDIADWLCGLLAEGGPAPETLWPGLGELAALVIGYNAHCAAQPARIEAPSVRPMQLAKVRAGLPCLCHELGLVPPDLPNQRPLTSTGD